MKLIEIIRFDILLKTFVRSKFKEKSSASLMSETKSFTADLKLNYKI